MCVEPKAGRDDYILECKGVKTIIVNTKNPPPPPKKTDTSSVSVQAGSRGWCRRARVGSIYFATSICIHKSKN